LELIIKRLRFEQSPAPSARYIYRKPIPKEIPAPSGSGIFGKSFFAGFEKASRVVVHTEFLQQRDLFLASRFLDVSVLAMSRRCRSCRSLKILFLLFYNDFAPMALPATSRMGVELNPSAIGAIYL
jgi:hypothetical protein